MSLEMEKKGRLALVALFDHKYHNGVQKTPNTRSNFCGQMGGIGIYGLRGGPGLKSWYSQSFFGFLQQANKKMKKKINKK